MSIKYRNESAVGQYDDNACWAACLEWWLKATKLGYIDQEDVFDNYPLLRDTNGTILREGLIQLIDDPRWYMKRTGFNPARGLTSSKLIKLLKDGPLYIGYYNQIMQSNHVNVIYGYSGGNLSVMEPHWALNPDGSYKGKHLTRKLGHYNLSGEIYIGTLGIYSGSGYDESYYY